MFIKTKAQFIHIRKKGRLRYAICGKLSGFYWEDEKDSTHWKRLEWPAKVIRSIVNWTFDGLGKMEV